MRKRFDLGYSECLAWKVCGIALQNIPTCQERIYCVIKSITYSHKAVLRVLYNYRYNIILLQQNLFTAQNKSVLVVQKPVQTIMSFLIIHMEGCGEECWHSRRFQTNGEACQCRFLLRRVHTENQSVRELNFIFLSEPRWHEGMSPVDLGQNRNNKQTKKTRV